MNFIGLTISKNSVNIYGHPECHRVNINFDGAHFHPNLNVPVY